ncbi:hypothetical protein PISMIDRAFT_671719 [Pisolithus microcarpus 441]|uniref:Uncharacterized protein n=1 Tax=Pisolithus microcarpus 441 TaxID=765257 RepID=A0A0D0A5Q5_9AGAM|nr:hypothetical protein BKA83DRAFT_671719 [Pisolithus microcarpus]KIK29777.1 hypothetical protein PISMIDRAFT_671719 [Pisolithus microcarpus 441]
MSQRCQHCDFYFASTCRFVDPYTGAKSSMQLGVTANGEGCRVASRLRREAVVALPKEVGGPVICIGQLRRFAREHEREAGGCGATEETNGGGLDVEGANDDAEDTSVNTPNQPVPIRRVDDSEGIAEVVRRGMLWVMQVSEYWPISRPSLLTEPEMRAVLSGSIALPFVGQYSPLDMASISEDDSKRKGRRGGSLTLRVLALPSSSVVRCQTSGCSCPHLIMCVQHWKAWGHSVRLG